MTAVRIIADDGREIARGHLDGADAFRFLHDLLESHQTAWIGSGLRARHLRHRLYVNHADYGTINHAEARALMEAG